MTRSHCNFDATFLSDRIVDLTPTAVSECRPAATNLVADVEVWCLPSDLQVVPSRRSPARERATGSDGGVNGNMRLLCQTIPTRERPNCMNWLHTHIAPRRPITPNRIIELDTSNQHSRWNTPQRLSGNHRKRIRNLRTRRKRNPAAIRSESPIHRPYYLIRKQEPRIF